MKVVRRQFFGLAGAAITAPLFARVAVAQFYPTRPVRFIVPSPPPVD
jgi:tripartite-type tricarboxylate transporter receptor subunit TctC